MSTELRKRPTAADTVSFEFSERQGMWRCLVSDQQIWSPSLRAGRRAVDAHFPQVDREIVTINETVDELLAAMHASSGEARHRLAAALVEHLVVEEIPLGCEDIADLLMISSDDLSTLIHAAAATD